MNLTSVRALSGRAPVLILLAALTLRILFSVAIYPLVSERLHWEGIDDGHDELAANLVRGHGFRFDPALPPNLTTPPGYAFFLAFIFRLAGIAMNEGWRIWLSHSLLDTASCLLVMVISLRVFGSRRASLVAGGLYAVYPQIIVYCARPFGEVLAVFVLLLAMTQALEMESTRAKGPALVSGILFGLAALVKEKLILFPPVLAGALAIKWRRRPGGRLVVLALLMAGTVVAVSPWLARGYHVTGKLIPITSRSGRALHWGLVSDYSLADEEAAVVPPGGRPDTLKWGMVFPPRPEGEKVGEGRARVEAEETLLASALKVVRERPWYFLRSCLVKAIVFWYWGQPKVIWVNFATQIPLLVLAAWGIVLGFRRGRIFVPVLLLLYFSGVHALLVARMRYSLPVMPYVIVLAGYTLARMTERPSPGIPGHRARARGGSGPANVRCEAR